VKENQTFFAIVSTFHSIWKVLTINHVIFTGKNEAFHPYFPF